MDNIFATFDNMIYVLNPLGCVIFAGKSRKWANEVASSDAELFIDDPDSLDFNPDKTAVIRLSDLEEVPGKQVDADLMFGELTEFDGTATVEIISSDPAFDRNEFFVF